MSLLIYLFIYHNLLFIYSSSVEQLAQPEVTLSDDCFASF